MVQEQSVFVGIDLSNGRGENEKFEDYINRRKQNHQLLKVYRAVGREHFQLMFPNGVLEAMSTTPEVDESN